jgi:hypothetical protein
MQLKKLLNEWWDNSLELYSCFDDSACSEAPERDDVENIDYTVK